MGRIEGVTVLDIGYVIHMYGLVCPPIRKCNSCESFRGCPNASWFSVCNGYVIGSAAPRGNHPLDLNRGRISFATHFHDI
jgi:hypothetical protein